MNETLYQMIYKRKSFHLFNLELCLQHEQVAYDVTYYPDPGGDALKTLNAVYTMK